MKLVFIINIFLLLPLGNEAFAQMQGENPVDSLRIKLLSVEADSNKMKVFNLFIDKFIAMGSYDSALTYAYRAQDLALEMKDRMELASVYNKIGLIYDYQSEYSEALQYYNTALEIFNEIDYNEGIINVLINNGVVYSYLSNYPKTLKIYQQALRISREMGNEYINAIILNNIGLVYNYLSKYPTALEYFQKALKINVNGGFGAHMAANYGNIGNVYYYLNDFSKALHFYEKSYEMNKQLGEKLKMSIQLGNIGLVYSVLSEYSEALDYFRRSLKISKQIEDKIGIAFNYSSIGEIYSGSNNYLESWKFHQRALEIYEQIGYKKELAQELINIGNLYLIVPDSILMSMGINQINRYNIVEQYADKALTINKEIKSVNGEAESWHLLNKIYEKLNKYKKAYNAYKNYILLQDSIQGSEVKRKITRLQVEYDYDKKMAVAKAEHEKSMLQQRWYLISGAFILLIGAFFFYYRQRLKASKNKALFEKEKEVDEAKTRFFQDISHEFRTPLSLIIGPIENMTNHEKDPDRKEKYSLMKRNANRLLNLINEIMDLSKVEAKKLPLHLQKVYLTYFIPKVMEEFKSLADSLQTELSFVCEEETFEVICDSHKMKTILINIISNSLKHTKNGKVKVALKKEKGRGNFTITIQDTGTGIPPDRVDKIFNRFYKGDENTRVNLSTGIGLALAKELVELHGGSISVKSEEDVGTIFIIEIPVKPAFAEADELSEQKETIENIEDFKPIITAADEGREEDGKEQPVILIIEDNADMRYYLHSILGDYHVIEAPNGNAGIQKALEEIPDLIVSDIMMPGKDGYEVCSILKQDIKTSHIPIILLTAKISNKSRIEGLEHEADYYLTKPFIPHELYVCIKNLIASREKLRQKFSRINFTLPEQVNGDSMEAEFMNRLIKVLKENYDDNEFTVEKFGKEIGMSRSQLHRKLHALTDESASEFIRNYRLQCAMEMLKKNTGTVAEICYEVGFNDPSYFNKCFQKFYGMTPASVMNVST